MFNSQLFIIIGLLIFVMILVGFLLLEISKLHKRINDLLNTSGGKNIEESLKKFYEDFNDKKEIISHTDRDLKDLIHSSKKFIDKFSIVNYNGYGDTGGNMSFVLCALNGENDGFILNSLHSRTGTRIYSKQIEKGVYSGTLSDEERKALQDAALVID